jgi:antitoxin YefM
MDITTYTNFRQNLKSFLDKVFTNHSPLFVTRSNGEDVVVLSKSDYESMQETFYLLKSPNNAARLLEGIAEYEKGLGQERNLIEGEGAA